MCRREPLEQAYFNFGKAKVLLGIKLFKSDFGVVLRFPVVLDAFCIYREISQNHRM